jgi:drug/metabolite transporter (DMT)-like permease
LLDALLLLTIVIWGSNFALVKSALADFPPLVFNAFRLLIASALFLVAIAVEARLRRRSGTEPAQPLTPADWRQLIGLAIVGHVIYQLCFVAGVARTSVGNAALIFGCTPVTVSLLSALAGHERIPRLRWVGAALSLAGIYAVVGHRTEWSTTGLIGDAIVIVAMFCWSFYSVASQPLLRRHSAVVVTGVSMAIGAACYALIALPSFIATDWGSISGLNWMLMIASAVLALGLAYMIWYTGIQRSGSSRTAMYTNLTPIVAMIVGALWLAEPITRAQVIGTVAILAGVAVTRLSPKGA